MSAFEGRVQRKAEDHLDACEEAMARFDEGHVAVPSPAYGPYCGCRTCVVREVLSVGWEELLAEAQREAIARTRPRRRPLPISVVSTPSTAFSP